MATSYTTLLGLALPVTGELQGTWGTTVNDSITSLLDTAVAGTTVLNTDADVTLSTTTGAANQARQAIILWTANGSVTRNITAPAQSKAYVVMNSSAGTQSIVIRGVGPTAGVTIVKGERALVAWNGSDFVKVSSAGVPLPIADGGTGLNSIAARSIFLANTANTLTTLTPAAGQSLRINAGNTAWEAYTPSVGDVTLAGNNAFTGANTFYNATGQTFGTATSTQDGIRIQGRSGGSSSFRVSLIPGTLTASRTFTLPDLDGTAAVINAAQTFTAAQTFRAANAVRSEAASTQDAMVLAGRAGGTGSFAVTLTPTTLTASRTVTFPDASTTVPVATQVITFSGPSAARTYTLPDSAQTLASLGVAQTFTAAQTFRAASAVRSEAASTQDAVVLAGRAGGTGSFAVTLTPTTLASSTTLTLPNVNDTLATIGTAQTFTAAQTFRAANSVRAEAAATQDAIVLAGRAGGTSSYAVTFIPTTLTSFRTLTLPDNTGTLLTTGATVTVAQGGTGATTLTGLVKGNGTSAFTAAVAGTDYVTPTGTEALSNKRIDPRSVVIADGTSITLNADTTDIAAQANTQAAGTLTINAPTGTPVNGQTIVLRLRSNNVQTFSWNAAFQGSTDLPLPAASSGGTKYDYMMFMYNAIALKWQILAKNFGF